MTLKRALDSLPRDRDTDSALRDVLTLMQRRAGEWIDASRLAKVVEEHHSVPSVVLGPLVKAFVLDFDGDADRYRMPVDRFLSLEVDGFLKRVGSQTNVLQANVARFRDRYGAR